MPSFVPHVTMDPRVHLPSTWKDGRGKPLTDKAIEDYERLGYYGEEAKKRRLALDGARVVDGITRLPRPCCECKNAMGHYMRFEYLPKAGYYCDQCRNKHRDAVEKEAKARRFYRSLEAFV